MFKLTSKQLTQAYTRFAARYGYSVSTVRSCTDLKIRAIAEWRERLERSQQALAHVATIEPQELNCY